MGAKTRRRKLCWPIAAGWIRRWPSNGSTKRTTWTSSPTPATWARGRTSRRFARRRFGTGAVDAVAEDARNLFVDWFVFPSLAAGALYEGKYPLATALGRPLIAQLMVRVARDHGATAVAHGCTGKGNDQVRFDVTFQTLAPELKIIAPVREWKWTRTQELEYAAKHGIEVEATKKSIFSTDQNLWGRSIEAGILEDPWVEPPPETFQWTTDPEAGSG